VDPLTGFKVIVAGERSRRPGGEPVCPAPTPIDPAGDPFADGHEDRTPPELYALRPDVVGGEEVGEVEGVREGGEAGAARGTREAGEAGEANTPGWSVRVVPNLFPALTPEHSDVPRDARPDLFTALPATGAHEVIINGPQPVLSLAELPVEQVIAAVGVWRERMRVHSESAYVQLIVNERREAGASLPHTHAQLYALDFVPADVARERERAGAYATRTEGQDLLGDLLAEEVRRGERIVALDEEAVMIAPYGSRMPYQLMLVPRRPRARFEDDGPTGAALLHNGLSRLARHFGSSPPLNLWVRTAPRGVERFCWRIDVVPRLTHLAGLELSTGVNLNIVAPEDAAAALREA
jgi:UDPglucose--hexose-1-phosphate uridylyltransferase